MDSPPASPPPCSDDEEQQPQVKRAKLDNAAAAEEDTTPLPEGAWRTVNLNCGTFRQFVYILKETLGSAHFVVRITPAFTGLCVDALHSSTAYIIKARYACQIQGSPELDGDTFCVDTKLLSAALKQLKPDAHISLELDHDTNRLRLNAVGRTRDTFELDTQDTEQAPFDMKKLNMRYAVDIELEALHGFCRNALASGATLINIVMEEPVAQPAGERVTFVTLKAKGDSISHTREFFSGTRNEEQEDGNQFSIRAIESTKDTWTRDYGKERTPLFNRSFGLKFLELLLKNMDSDKIRLNMHPDFGMPLIVCCNLGGSADYNVGGSASFIHTLLAHTDGGASNE